MGSACRRMRLGDSQQRRDESVVVEVSGDERLRGGPCSPGASGPTGVPLVGELPGGGLPVAASTRGVSCSATPEGLLAKGRATLAPARGPGLLVIGEQAGPLPRAGAARLTASRPAACLESRPGRRAVHPRCSLAQAALLAYPGAAHRGRAAFSWTRVLGWCEHLLPDDDGCRLPRASDLYPPRGEQLLRILLGLLLRRCQSAPHC